MQKKKTNQIKGLQQEIMDLKIESHRKGYIHIPFSWKRVGLFFLFLGSIGLAILNFIVLLSNYYIWHIDEVFKPTKEINQKLIGIYQLGIIPQLLFEYVLIGLVFICLVVLIKGSFSKIKKIEDVGLIYGLIGGLIYGLIVGLIIGLIGGLIGGFYGLIYGLIAGLIAGLIGGLIEELSSRKWVDEK